MYTALFHMISTLTMGDGNGPRSKCKGKEKTEDLRDCTRKIIIVIINPFSLQTRNSNTEYALAPLRKSLKVPNRIVTTLPLLIERHSLPFLRSSILLQKVLVNLNCTILHRPNKR